jgi:hypothetical protein
MFLIDLIKQYLANILRGIGAAALAILIVVAFAVLAHYIGTNPIPVTSLPILAIGGVAFLIIMLTFVAMVFSLLGITDRSQALGLPEGSIRAVIALSLIVLFAILTVFLYQGVSGVEARHYTLENMSDTERAQFLRDHPTAQDVQAITVKDKDGQPLVVKGPNGQPLTTADGMPRYLYNISYRTQNPAADDFAKQLLVLLGTLMTAVTSFYLGAGTATSAAAPPRRPANGAPATTAPPPKVDGVTPSSHEIAKDGSKLHLQIAGSNLSNISDVKIVRGKTEVSAQNVSATATSVTCDIDVSATITPPGGAWDVVVSDRDAQSAKLSAKLNIT